MPTPSPIISPAEARTRASIRWCDANRDDREADAEPEEGVDERQAHRQDGAERDEEDHDGGADADEFAQSKLGRLTEHAGQLDLQIGLIRGGDGLDGLEGGVVEPLLRTG